MADRSTAGFAIMNDESRRVAGAGDHEVIDLSSALAMIVPEKILNCRYFMVDVDGIIKFQYETNDFKLADRVMQVTAGKEYPWRNIKGVYPEYATGVDCTCQVYTDEGELVTGITLCR